MRTGSANSAVLCSRKPNHNWANFNMKSNFITDIFPKIHSFYYQSSLVRGTDSSIENNMNYIVCLALWLNGRPTSTIFVEVIIWLWQNWNVTTKIPLPQSVYFLHNGKCLTSLALNHVRLAYWVQKKERALGMYCTINYFPQKNLPLIWKFYFEQYSFVTLESF